MYVSENDRRKIIQIIFKALRAEKRINQKSLAVYAGVNQAVVSAIETLPGASRSLTRGDLIKSIRGLSLKKPGLKINALLWLFDGNPLSLEERKTFKLKDIQSTEAFGTKEKKTILELLQEAASFYKREPVKSITVISQNEDDELAIYREFLGIEEEDGVRVLMKRTPSSLSYPKEIYGRDKGIPSLITSSKGKKEFICIREKRVSNFYDRIQIFGEKIIHVEGEIKSYLSDKEHLSGLTKFERRLHVESLISLLDQYEDTFQVRLIDHLPLHEYGVKGFDKVIVTAEFDPPEKTLVRYIQLFGEEAAIPFLLDFERLWESTSREQKNNRDVIKRLSSLLEQSKSKV